MSAGDVVCTGWLIKSPPEKKLKRYAWRKRWFVLRRGRMSGNPDVLEYYRNKHSKKPLRVIDLNECGVHMHTRSDAGMVKREFVNNHVFVVKTSFRTFYLVAKTQEEMNTWVHNISQICHFGPLDDGTDSVESLSQTASSLQPSPSASTHTSRITDDISLSANDLTADTDTNTTEESHSESDSSLPPDYLFLSQCESGRINIPRCNTWSQTDRWLEQNSSDSVFEDVILSPLNSYQPPSPSPFSPLDTALSSSTDQSTFTPLERGASSRDFTSSSPLTAHAQPQIFQFDKNLVASALGGTPDGNTPPPRPPKPKSFSERRQEEFTAHTMLVNGNGAYAVPASSVQRRISLSGLDNVRRVEFEGISIRSRDKRLSLNLPRRVPAYSPSPVDVPEDSYVPMNPGASPPISTFDCPSDGYILMSPTSAKFLLSNGNTEPGPPPVKRHLKPLQRARPPPLDLRGLTTIREHPIHMPLIRSSTEPFPCNPAPGRATASVTFGEEESSFTPGEHSRRNSPVNTNIFFPLPRKSNLDYLALDFNSASPSPVQKKPMLADEMRVDYVQVDEQKTQALQNTKQEWTDVRQSKV
ncbi:GRB2-associated-binding protein 3-like [Acipenser oxyrinchus oxyrinchus]|uniref:GRB2-associated-binding protein 3-like n=1 Tax=Acipenser oxyrinchus oxyrinchus TaxID=40147 RepID=A0AAD8D5T8_ACIOX|nr:GRB2-associated-binding protein 3-like [Acipenser oxyrinchus oxyrinchus]